ncbi:hypothetical protein H920_15795 [Fukomys damarensis]|uniref:Uncharacterized protein n=1 Tax=Fukomys damarensis TaxID=885580 RepID=A0A091CX84_FUKDA|nr:hypothetical protein H920_15795 [Fukomys damarensis]
MAEELCSSNAAIRHAHKQAGSFQSSANPEFLHRNSTAGAIPVTSKFILLAYKGMIQLETDYGLLKAIWRSLVFLRMEETLSGCEELSQMIVIFQEEKSNGMV